MDIVDRLHGARDAICARFNGDTTTPLACIPARETDIDLICQAAADEIERLRFALEKISSTFNKPAHRLWHDPSMIAHAALKGDAWPPVNTQHKEP